MKKSNSTFFEEEHKKWKHINILPGVFLDI